MKHTTSLNQTTKLIELGLPKPRYYSADKYTIIYIGFEIINYSIGDLIEILDSQGIEIQNFGYWIVEHEWYTSTKDELIDALYDCIVKLKELKKL